jgi:hypothetical protein
VRTIRAPLTQLVRQHARPRAQTLAQQKQQPEQVQRHALQTTQWP